MTLDELGVDARRADLAQVPPCAPGLAQPPVGREQDRPGRSSRPAPERVAQPPTSARSGSVADQREHRAYAAHLIADAQQRARLLVAESTPGWGARCGRSCAPPTGRVLERVAPPARRPLQLADPGLDRAKVVADLAGRGPRSGTSSAGRTRRRPAHAAACRRPNAAAACAARRQASSTSHRASSPGAPAARAVLLDRQGLQPRVVAVAGCRRTRSPRRTAR